MTMAQSTKNRRDANEIRRVSDVSAVVEEEFGNYRIKAGRLSGVYVARAFPKVDAPSKGLIAEASGESEVEAIRALKSLIHERDVKRTAVRRSDERSGVSVPSTTEFTEALLQVRLSDAQDAILKALAISGESGLTELELMNAAGYRSQGTVDKVIARAGVLIADYLSVSYPEEPALGASMVIAVKHAANGQPTATWTMHEELREAVWATI